MFSVNPESSLVHISTFLPTSIKYLLHTALISHHVEYTSNSFQSIL
jgi:hypothetical protein